MPIVLTIVLMLAVAYSFTKEGVFTAFCMMVNVFLAGLVAFNYYEPLATSISGVLDGYEDAICMVGLFAGTAALLRALSNILANTEITHHPTLYQIGAGVFGLVTGYLLAGFLFCMLQTLPWHENFMNLDMTLAPGEPGTAMRRVLPPDRVWLAMMHRASVGPFAQSGGKSFDEDGSFEWRYARYRRYNDTREPIPYTQELEPLPPTTPPSQ